MRYTADSLEYFNREGFKHQRESRVLPAPGNGYRFDTTVLAIAAMKKVAVMLKKHLSGLLAYFRHPISNAKSEACNSRIQSIKSAARGFRSFENYRTRILFYCGKLDLKPKISH